MSLIERFREWRAQSRDFNALRGHLWDLEDRLTDVRFERDWWQNIAVDSQLEADALKRQLAQRGQ